jgi:hypothetical protein
MWLKCLRESVRVAGVLVALAGVAFAQPAVDVVSLKTGRTLRGAVLHRQPDGTATVAVARTWLQTANQMLFAQYDPLDRAAQREAWTSTRDRLQTLLDNPPAAPRLVFFLTQERDRLDKLLAADEPPPSPFLLIELTGKQIAKVTPASPDRQRLALLAWQEELPDVETRTADALKTELTKRQVKLDGPLPDLSDRLPARPQDDHEWTARLAVLEYTHRQPVDFQGTGDTLVRTGGDQKTDLAAIFQKLLRQQVDTLLQDLLTDGRLQLPAAKPDREWLSPAIAAAQTAGARGFRVTRLQLDAQALRVVVETRFVARLADDNWQTIWLTTEPADGSTPRPDLEAQIANDPQVKSALESLRAVAAIDDAALRRAIRLGAATMSAQQTADSRFFAFAARYAQRADGPRLHVGVK